MSLFARWLILTLAIVITAYVLPAVTVTNLFAALIAALVLGTINLCIRPFILLITLPINILTLGLFTLVINAALIMLASHLVPGFIVRTFWSAVIFGLVLSIMNSILTTIFSDNEQKSH